MISGHRLPVAVLLAGLVAVAMHLGPAARAEVIAAAFVIVGYSTWMGLSSWRDACEDVTWRRYLASLPANRPAARVRRLAREPRFWWSLLAGAALVTIGVWRAGVEQPVILTALGIGWSAVAGVLNYELTLLHPTTRCRDCHYELAGHLDASRPEQKITCPECGRLWRKSDLCLVAAESRMDRLAD